MHHLILLNHLLIVLASKTIGRGGFGKEKGKGKEK
jgi:hypothetical protein